MDVHAGIFEDLEDAFNAAMISNDTSQISECISEDWVLVTPEAGPVPRERIMSAIWSGSLIHDSMVSQIKELRVYGDSALVISRGQNTGHFQGQPISADEWITNAYRKVDERWICVLTHLTPAQ